MTGMLRDLLQERADAAGGPDLDLEDLVARGERQLVRRRRAALAVTAAVVALTVGASVALVRTEDRTAGPLGPPDDTPSSVDVVPDTTDGARPLTYGLGAIVHYGDRTIEMPEDADGLYVVDDGLAILTGADGTTRDTRLFFTDGGRPVEIAQGIGRVTAGESGSVLLWLDGDDVVLYDTDTRSILGRLPLHGRLLTNPITVLEDSAYWHEYVEDTATTDGRDRLVRYDVATGARTRTSEADYRAEARTTPLLVVGSVDSTDGVDGFTVVDSQLAVDNGSGATEPVFLASTGERLRVKLPNGYDGQSLTVFHWLDEDRFALVADGGVKQAPIGDLLLCRVSAGRCDTVAQGEQEWLLPGSSGGVGSED